MANVKIVTDSTSDLPPELARKLGIDIIPVNMIIDGKRYRDGVDINAEQFYQNFDRFRTMYTEPVTYEEYLEKYKQVTRENEEVLFINCSKRISETYANGLKVHKDYEDSHNCKVGFINSRIATMGLGLTVIAAARAALKGRSMEAIKNLVAYCIPRIFIYVGVPNLKYMRKGKKISGIKSLIGSAIGMKPVLAFDEEGKIVLKSKIMGKRNMMLEMLEHITDHVGESQINLCIVHAGAKDLAEELKDVYSQKFKCKSTYISYVSPAIGINTGPGSTGIIYFRYD